MSKRNAELIEAELTKALNAPSTEQVGNGERKSAAMSPAVADIETGIKGVQLTLREDGSVTMRLSYRGLAPKQLTMYPIQWEALADVVPKLKGKFSETGTPIATVTVP
jgi:hypothetical protein